MVSAAATSSVPPARLSCSLPLSLPGDLLRCYVLGMPRNRTWTHGIPHHDYDADGDIGPRMSIALLCAEGDFQVPFVESTFKIPGGLVISGATSSGGGGGGGQCVVKP